MSGHSFSGDFLKDIKESHAADTNRKMVSLRLTGAARRLLREQAKQLGISQSALVELLLRAQPWFPNSSPGRKNARSSTL